MLGWGTWRGRKVESRNFGKAKKPPSDPIVELLGVLR